MQRFCANISMLYGEADFLQRYQLAAQDGFAYVECLFPYAHSMADVKTACDLAGVKQHLFNTDAGNWQQGERGFACRVDKIAKFRRSMHQALDYAHALKTPLVHVMAGNSLVDSTNHKAQQQAESVYINNLQWAGALAKQAGVMLTIEAINPIDMPHYFVSTQEQAIALVRNIAADNVKLQFDFYHCETHQGQSLKRCRDYFDDIVHVQIAGVPNRHEPDIGDLDYQAVLRQLTQLRYAGRIGCEYHPLTTTRDGLAWLHNIGCP